MKSEARTVKELSNALLSSAAALLAAELCADLWKNVEIDKI